MLCCSKFKLGSEGGFWSNGGLVQDLPLQMGILVKAHRWIQLAFLPPYPGARRARYSSGAFRPCWAKTTVTYHISQPQVNSPWCDASDQLLSIAFWENEVGFDANKNSAYALMKERKRHFCSAQHGLASLPAIMALSKPSRASSASLGSRYSRNPMPRGSLHANMKSSPDYVDWSGWRSKLADRKVKL